MADNILLNSGSGGSTLATDDDATAHHQYVKMEFGPDNTQTKVADTASAQLPVGGSGATALGKAEDAAHTTADVGVMALSVRQNAAASTSGTDGDYQPLITDTNGRLHTNDVSTAAALSGNEFQVDVVAALPAGTNAIGKLAANSGVDIGDVDVTSVPAPLNVTGGGTEAAALRVTLANNSTGVVSVDDGGGALTVDNGGTFVTQVDGAALTALQLIDDIVHVDDTATHATGTTKGAGIMAAAAPTDGSVGANDIGMLAMSTDRRLHTDTQLVGQDADITIADGGNAITTDWAGTAPPIGAGTEAAALRVTVATNSTGLLSVDDGGGALTVDGTVTANPASGTIDTVTTVSTVTAVTSLDKTVHVDDAGFTLGADSGTMMMGFAGTQSVDANDAGAIAMETDGAIHIHDGGNAITVDGTVTANLSVTDNTVLDNIQTSVDTVAAAVSTQMQCDIVAALPAGTNEIGKLAAGTAAIGKLAANSGIDIGDVTLTAGTAAIGKLAANTGVDIGDVDVTSQPARDRTTDNVGAAHVTDAIMSDTTALTPKFAVITASSSGNTEVVALVSAKKIRVLSYMLTYAGNVNCFFRTSTAGASLSGLLHGSGDTLPKGAAAQYNPLGHFETVAGEALGINISANIVVGGHLTYIEV